MTSAAPSRACMAAEWTTKSLDIDQGVQLAAVHLLGGVITHCVVFAAPFMEWPAPLLHPVRDGKQEDDVLACVSFERFSPL